MRHALIPPDQEILFRLPTVTDVTGNSRAKIYRDIAAGTFPAPVQLGARSVAWKKSDVDAWIQSRPPATMPPAGMAAGARGHTAKPPRVVTPAPTPPAKRRR